eukprot:Lithocolla_globosa_v1_NODE_2227_length_2101_cov_10.459922.p2 type:complete len:178 gc:universal NODE_2227_length_2101_cov_10.459922:1067-1600(+)
MVKLRLPMKQIEVAMRRGSLDLLTIVQEHQIPTTIKYIREFVIDEKYQDGDSDSEGSGDTDKNVWDEYWTYFEKTWTKLYDFNVWNTSGATKKDKESYSRNSGCIERFNEKMHTYFPNPHPNLFLYVDTIRKISEEYVQLMKEIQNGTAQPPKRAEIIKIKIPKKLKELLDAEENSD